MALGPIVHGIGVGLFICGGASAIGVIAASVAPQWQRICRLALGNVEPASTTAPVALAAKVIRL